MDAAAAFRSVLINGTTDSRNVCQPPFCAAKIDAVRLEMNLNIAGFQFRFGLEKPQNRRRRHAEESPPLKDVPQHLPTKFWSPGTIIKSEARFLDVIGQSGRQVINQVFADPRKRWFLASCLKA